MSIGFSQRISDLVTLLGTPAQYYDIYLGATYLIVFVVVVSIDVN